MGNRWIAAVALVLVAAIVGGCSASDPDPTVAPRRQANAFLDGAKKADLGTLCSLFTTSFLERFAPPTGDCSEAMATLTRFTGAGEADTLGTKRVQTVKVNGDTATVVLADKISGGNELPMRMVRRDDVWLIDDIGAGATISQACIDERTATLEAVDEYLSDNDEYPPDAKALVPGYLPKIPDNHAVSLDGSVTAKGICA